MSHLRTSTRVPRSVTLFCAKCDAYIGKFQNEWQHVTTSYAMPVQPGELIEANVEEKTRTVPSGPSQKAAEGCDMANVLCSECSTTIGQFCVKVQRRDQKYLLDKYLYKLTKVKLMDLTYTRALDFNFVDDGESVATLSRTLTDRHAIQDLVETQTPPQPPVETFMMLSRQMYEHGAAINDNFNRIATTNGRIATESARINVLEAHTASLDDRVQNLEPSRDQQASMDAIQAEMKANLTRYLQHEEAIQDLQALVAKQREQILQLTAELFAVRNYNSTQKDPRKPELAKQSLRRGPSSGLSPSSTNRIIQDIRQQREHESDKEDFSARGKRKRNTRSQSGSCKASRRTSGASEDQPDAFASMPTPESTQELRRISTRNTPSVSDREGIATDLPIEALDDTISDRVGDSVTSQFEGVDVQMVGLGSSKSNAQTPLDEDVESRVEEMRFGMQNARKEDKQRPKPAEVAGRVDTEANHQTTEIFNLPAEAIDFSDDDDEITQPGTLAKVTMPERVSGDQKMHRQGLDNSNTGTPTPATMKPLNKHKHKVVPKDLSPNCVICGRFGRLLCCERCQESTHLNCLPHPVRHTAFKANWVCPKCIEIQADNRDAICTGEL